MPVSLKFNCPADWSAMSHCGQSRFCGQCSKQVHEVSALSEAEAETILDTPDTCVRMEVNQAGQIRTRGGFSTALLFGSAMAIGCGDGTTDTILSNTHGGDQETEVLMGDVEPVEPFQGKATLDNSKDCEDKEESKTATETDANSTEDCEGKEEASTAAAGQTEAPATSGNQTADSTNTGEVVTKPPRPAVMGKVHRPKPAPKKPVDK